MPDQRLSFQAIFALANPGDPVAIQPNGIHETIQMLVEYTEEKERVEFSLQTGKRLATD